MSALTSSSIVLVSGANGHVAQHVVDQLLAHPARLRVRGTVRSDSSAVLLRTHYAKEVAEGRLQIARVPDIVAEGAFDEAIKDITHVAHIASPLPQNVRDVETDLLQPAIRGTLNILKAATKAGTVKAVVVTSSFAAMADNSKGWYPGHTYTSDDWNPITYEEAASPDLDYSKFPPQLRPYITYCASKVCAERAGWDYWRNTSPGYSLTFIHPVYIAGPSVLPLPEGAASLSFSNQLIWRSGTDKELPTLDFVSWVDVRDVAKAHIAALEQLQASGKRYLASWGATTYGEIADIIRSEFPQLKPPTGDQKLEHYHVDGTPALTELGLGEYIGLKTMVVDTVAQALQAEELKSDH